MRQIINLLAALYPCLRYGSWTIMLLLVFSLSSCFRQFYQTNSVHKTDAESLEQFRLQNKHFIIHSSGGIFALKNIRLTSETLSGQRDSLNPKNKKFLNPVGEYGMPVKQHAKDRCFAEVHLYTSGTINEKDSVNLLISQINRVDSYGPDEKAIKDSRIASIIGITIGTTAIIGLGFLVSYNLTLF